MRLPLFFILFLSFLKANDYIYLLDEYEKETQLEAKIVVNIARDILDKKVVNLYIPNAKKLDLKIYSSMIKLVDSCAKANFIFAKYNKGFQCNKNINIPYSITNNYKRLLTNKNYLGAFFWSKSRPNIVLVKERLLSKRIHLPKEYNRFIEDIK